MGETLEQSACGEIVCRRLDECLMCRLWDGELVVIVGRLFQELDEVVTEIQVLLEMDLLIAQRYYNIRLLLQFMLNTIKCSHLCFIFLTSLNPLQFQLRKQ